jgi:hypothetical protein
MLRPTITDYVSTIESHSGMFRTLGEPALKRDLYGSPELWAGNSAAIFTYLDTRGSQRFLKCYIRPNPHLRAIYRYIERHRPPLLPAVRLLPEELFVHTISGKQGWVDIVEGPWIHGDSLARTIAGAARASDARRLTALADAFDTLWASLLTQEWAHGDLKPENIIVGKDGSLSLIDCDAMWIPELAGQKAAEFGTPPYRQRGRTSADFDKRIDDYSASLISTALRLFSLIPSLWAGRDAFNNLVISIQAQAGETCST